ncbi:hypothetical protein DPMN_142757 [Dreissena polymorpha]|uniref:Uncharacterized protein n=1 Tax=Dreissena polymorpha TaxID=45954 RepID=A0A9D4JMH3_DREPO|nr:hypothetical protein DPMN_142757 [Dreissena polymorpha]
MGSSHIQELKTITGLERHKRNKTPYQGSKVQNDCQIIIRKTDCSNQLRKNEERKLHQPGKGLKRTCQDIKDHVQKNNL